MERAELQIEVGGVEVGSGGAYVVVYMDGEEVALITDLSGPNIVLDRDRGPRAGGRPWGLTWHRVLVDVRDSQCDAWHCLVGLMPRSVGFFFSKRSADEIVRMVAQMNRLGVQDWVKFRLVGPRQATPGPGMTLTGAVTAQQVSSYSEIKHGKRSKF
eukprot:3636555-Rhodomonas_salina.1